MFVGYVRCIGSTLGFSDDQVERACQLSPTRASRSRWIVGLMVLVTACGKSGQSSSSGGAFNASSGAGGLGEVAASGGDGTSQGGAPSAGSSAASGGTQTAQGGATGG